MGPRESKPVVVQSPSAESGSQLIPLMLRLFTTQSDLAKLEAQQKENEKERKAEQVRMQEEMEATEKRFEDNKKKQEEALSQLRAEHARRVAEMVRQRENDRELFQGQLSEMERKSEETVKKMDLEKLEHRREIMLKQLMMDRAKFDTLYGEYFCSAMELARINARIAAEDLRLAKFSEVRHDPDCLRIVLFGKTGHGKSSVGSRLIGDRTYDMSGGGFRVSFGTQSVTQSITGLLVDPKDPSVEHLKYKHKFLVVDVPGTSETRGVTVASQHVNRMVDYLKGIEFINIVGVVRNGQDTRATTETVDMLRSLVAAFGDRIWPHVVLIITHVRSELDYRNQRRMEYDRKKMDAWIEQFRKEIRDPFHLSAMSAPLPAVKIDNMVEEDYTQKCSTLVNSHALSFLSSPFKCDNLSSELDRWKNQALIQENETNDDYHSMKKCVTIVNALINELDRIETQMSKKSADSMDLTGKAMSMGIDLAWLERIDAEKVEMELETEKGKVYAQALAEAKESYVVEDEEEKKEDEEGKEDVEGDLFDVTAPA